MRSPEDDQEAYRQLVGDEIPVLLRVAMSLTSQPADAQDLVQETLLRAWRSFRTFDGRHPRAWLLTIMRNAHRNSARTVRPDPMDPMDIPAVATTASVEEHVTGGVWDEAVAAGLAMLKPETRRLVLLVDVDGLSYSEAGAVLGIPQGTVMSRLHRGRKSIKRYVDQQRASLPASATIDDELSLWVKTFGSKDMISCSKAMRLLQPALDGELDSATLASVNRHLQACLKCGMQAHTYLAIKRSIAATGRTVLPAAIVSDLEAFLTDLPQGA